jgi:hypothetical protein
MFVPSDEQIERGVKELMDDRNSYGDGCFGCGYGGFWTVNNIDENAEIKAHYRKLVRNVLVAALSE